MSIMYASVHTSASTGYRHAPYKSLQRNTRCRSVSRVQSDTRASTTTNILPSLPQLLPLDGNYESSHAFARYANWLIPGHVMLGRYPFVEPSRCLSREEGEEQLTAILKAGITTFFSLQEELPPQSQLRIIGKDGFLPYKATAELIQASLNGPPPMDVINGLRNPTLDRFLPPRSKKTVANSLPPPFLPQCAHFPIVDLSVPDEEGLQRLILDLEYRLAVGEKLYIHCWGGRGRAGTIGACLLASLYKVSAEEALERVQRAFDTRCDEGRKSPETDEQRQLVKKFVEGVGAQA